MLRALPSLLRFLISALLLGSIVWQIADRIVHNVFRPGEYFAYFTIQSSMVAAVTLAVAGWFTLSGKEETRLLALVRLSVACFASLTGIVYNLLLRGLPAPAADAGYNWPVIPNEVLHCWGPGLIALEFVVFAPKAALSLRAGLWVWAFPFAWLGFSVIRGLASGWWPYWFINPTGEGGISGMLAYVFGIMTFLYVLALVFLGLKKLRNSATRA
jgi:hypothetical protein